MLANIGASEIILLLIVLVLFFGGTRLSSLAKSAGEATKEIKKAKEEFEEAKKDILKDYNKTSSS